MYTTENDINNNNILLLNYIWRTLVKYISKYYRVKMLRTLTNEDWILISNQAELQQIICTHIQQGYILC